MRRGRSCPLQLRRARRLLLRMARRWLLLHSIRFNHDVPVIPSFLFPRFSVSALFSGDLVSGLAASGRVIRSGDATGTDLGTATVEALGISAGLGPTPAIRTVTARAGRMRQRKGR